LAYKYFGPFQVLQKIDNVAYKLELPASSLTHTVFNVSQLNKMTKEPVTQSAKLPDELSKLRVPEVVLNRRLSTCGVRSVQQGLIKWSNSPATLATWEDLKPLKQHFPDAPAWGKLVPMEGELLRPLYLVLRLMLS
jgi:hypothetical protein